jgi:hypothetical protein
LELADLYAQIIHLSNLFAIMTDSKPSQMYTEDAVDNSSSEKEESPSQAPVIPEYDKRQTTKILWKIDWRLIPFLSLLYL